MYIHFPFQKGRAMSLAVSRRPLTADARVRCRVDPCGICGGQSGTGTGLSPSTSVVPCQYNFINAPYLSPFTCCPYQKDKRAKVWELPKKITLFRKLGCFG
jgi:hypothetical protein